VQEADFTSRDHSITQDSLKDLKDFISGIKEDIEDQLDQVQKTISTADTSLLAILQDDQARLQSSLDSITRAQQVADTAHPKIIIEHNKAGQGSRAIFGTDTTQPRFDLTVAHNTAELGATVSAGVHSTQTLQALLRTSRTPDLALALQALQTQSQSTSDEALQSILNNLSAERNSGLTDIQTETNLSTSPRSSKYVEGRGFSEAPSRSTGSMYRNAGKDSKALERSNE
jgi:phage-related protein